MAIVGRRQIRHYYVRLNQVAHDWCLLELRKVDFSATVGNVVIYPSTLRTHFEARIFTPKSLQIVGFWVMALCSLVRGYWHFKEAYCFHLQLAFEDVGPKLSDG